MAKLELLRVNRKVKKKAKNLSQTHIQQNMHIYMYINIHTCTHAHIYRYIILLNLIKQVFYYHKVVNIIKRKQFQEVV